MRKVLGVGAALVDILGNVDDEWVLAQGVEKGGRNSVDWPRMERLISGISNPVRVPGGSNCNTIVGIARLGGNASFISRVGNDDLGHLFRDYLKANGVDALFSIDAKATGCVLSAVTPDAERSMWTYLGASEKFSVADFSRERFDGVGLFLAEGYNAFDADCFKESFRIARNLNVETAVDFSSFDVVHACRKTFDGLFDERLIDIIIANEDEAYAYTGLREEAALEDLSKKAKIAVVKIGKRGSLIAYEGNIIHVPAGSAKAVDTTGAGDLWASGFLFGYMNGWTMERSGNLGSIVSNEVVQVMGAQIPEEGWNRILSQV